MLVKAIRIGYYGHKRRRKDDKFEIKEDKDIIGKDGKKKVISEFSESWMEKVGKKEEKSTPAKTKTESKAKAGGKDVSEVSPEEEVI